MSPFLLFCASLCLFQLVLGSTFDEAIKDAVADDEKQKEKFKGLELVATCLKSNDDRLKFLYGLSGDEFAVSAKRFSLYNGFFNQLLDKVDTPLKKNLELFSSCFKASMEHNNPENTAKALIDAIEKEVIPQSHFAIAMKAIEDSNDSSYLESFLEPFLGEYGSKLDLKFRKKMVRYLCSLACFKDGMYAKLITMERISEELFLLLIGHISQDVIDIIAKQDFMFSTKMIKFGLKYDLSNLRGRVPERRINVTIDRFTTEENQHDKVSMIEQSTVLSKDVINLIVEYMKFDFDEDF